MSNTADVIIIGAGVHGASLAFHLAGRGVKPLVLEKNFVGAGATGRSSGLVRMHYDVRQDLELAWVSFDYFRNWEEKVGGDTDCGFARIVQDCTVTGVIVEGDKVKGVNTSQGDFCAHRDQCGRPLGGGAQQISRAGYSLHHMAATMA